jgi:hypothetical protein
MRYNHTYNSLIWYHSTRLIESCRISPRLIKSLHYWVLWRSKTRKPRFRNARSEVPQRKRVAKSRKNWIFSTTQSIFKRFLICLRKNHLSIVIFLHIYFFSNHRVIVVAIQHFCNCLFVYDNFEVRRNKLREYLH